MNDILDAPTHACRHCGIPVVLSALLHGLECRACFDNGNARFPIGSHVELRPGHPQRERSYQYRMVGGVRTNTSTVRKGLPIEVVWRRERSFHWHDELVSADRDDNE